MTLTSLSHAMHLHDATKRVIATAQDIKYARLLAGNEQRVRDRAIASLRKWFQARMTAQIPLTECDLLLIWKGLFYSMWMSDKPLIQEECSERIASLIHVLDARTGVVFFATGMRTLANEWYGIDQWRTDKFLMLVRRVLRHAFQLLKTLEWSTAVVQHFSDVLVDLLTNTQHALPVSLAMHLSDVYLPELAKVSEGRLPANKLNTFVAPFARAIAGGSDVRLLNAFADNVFRYLIRQSTRGLHFQEKFNVWKQMGFPGGHINALQRSSDEDISKEVMEKETTGLDARAGRVNVVLPQIQFSCKHLQQSLREVKANARNTKARALLAALIVEFGDLDVGEYPYGVKRVENALSKKLNVHQAARKLIAFENKIYARRKRRGGDKQLEIALRDALYTSRQLQTDKARLIKHNVRLQRKKRRLETEITACGVFERNSGTWFVHDADSETDVDETVSPKRRRRHSPSVDSNKKVTIDLRLNRSQEMHEHVAQLRSSPGNPFDATRTPGKPLIKSSSPAGSPINPFYERR